MLVGLGIEPLSRGFGGKKLREIIGARRVSTKDAIMNARLVAGVGNIYANEALFDARISPMRPAASLGDDECARLARSIKKCLQKAIKAGGSTLKDFRDANGAPGYFQINHNVYGRADEKCRLCAGPIRLARQSQRATYHCPACQT